MPKIHGLVYVFVGLFVSVLSWRLNYQKLIFFFYAGLIFVFAGIVKLTINFVKSKKNKTQNMHHKIQRQSQRLKYCSKCGNVVRIQDRFCSKCGNRF